MKNKDLPASDDHKNHRKEPVAKKLGDKIGPVNGDRKKDGKTEPPKNDRHPGDRGNNRDDS